MMINGEFIETVKNEIRKNFPRVDTIVNLGPGIYIVNQGELEYFRLCLGRTVVQAEYAEPGAKEVRTLWSHETDASIEYAMTSSELSLLIEIPGKPEVETIISSMVLLEETYPKARMIFADYMSKAGVWKDYQSLSQYGLYDYDNEVTLSYVGSYVNKGDHKFCNSYSILCPSIENLNETIDFMLDEKGEVVAIHDGKEIYPAEFDNWIHNLLDIHEYNRIKTNKK